MNSRLHPIDRLIRRVQTEPGSQDLDLEIGRALYGSDVRLRKGRMMILKISSQSKKWRDLPQYTASVIKRRHAIRLLRKRKAELTTVEPLRMAA